MAKRLIIVDFDSVRHLKEQKIVVSKESSVTCVQHSESGLFLEAKFPEMALRIPSVYTEESWDTSLIPIAAFYFACK